MIKAPIKCPGGKKNLVTALEKNLPEDFFINDYKYIEPFSGGASFALHLLNKKPSLISILNDKNLFIQELWNYIKNDPETIIDEYNSILEESREYEVEPRKLSKNFYNRMREKLPSLYPNKIITEKDCALFLFLNLNCYNGLIRFNSKGRFNVPMGSYPKTQTINKNNILETSKLIQKIQIFSLDFQEFIQDIIKEENIKNMFFYFDPPYIPISKTSSFTSYNPNGFTLYDQYRLKFIIDYLTSRGIKIMLSNSSSKITQNLYKNYNIKGVLAPRSINSKGNKRGKIKEFIITNY